MANKPEKEYYSYLEINKTQRTGFAMLGFFMYGLLAFSIMAGIIRQAPWTALIIPTLLFCLPVALYPQIEEWKYLPWQAKPRKYETHYID